LGLLAHDARWGWLLGAAGLLNLTLWALIHECIHGSLTGRPRWDAWCGRGLSMVFGAPFRVLRVGHLLHHKFNRQDEDASEVFDDRRLHRREAAWGYYAKLLGGLYVGEALCCVLFLLPRSVLQALARRLAADQTSLLSRLIQAVLSPRSLNETRCDALATLALWGTGAWCYGRHAWMLAAFWALRALTISLHDNVYHYDTPLGDAGARTLRLPAAVSALILHFNYHDTHHRHPRLSWRALPGQFALDGARMDGAWTAALVAQLHGPLPRSHFLDQGVDHSRPRGEHAGQAAGG
jgi:fatty acid desaturase